MNELIKLSRFAYAFPQSEMIGLYHALNIDVLFISIELWQVLESIRFGARRKTIAKAIGEDNLRLFEEHEFIVPYSVNEEAMIRRIREEELQGVNLNIM